MVQVKLRLEDHAAPGNMCLYCRNSFGCGLLTPVVYLPTPKPWIWQLDKPLPDLAVGRTVMSEGFTQAGGIYRTWGWMSADPAVRGTSVVRIVTSSAMIRYSGLVLPMTWYRQPGPWEERDLERAPGWLHVIVIPGCLLGAEGEGNPQMTLRSLRA